MENTNRTFPKGYCISCMHHDYEDDQSQYCMLKNHPIAARDCCENYEDKPYEEKAIHKYISRIRIFFSL